jgi:hypothetical protein
MTDFFPIQHEIQELQKGLKRRLIIDWAFREFNFVDCLARIANKVCCDKSPVHKKEPIWLKRRKLCDAFGLRQTFVS